MPDLIGLVRPGTDGFLVLCLTMLFLLINLLAYTAFALDKRRALLGQWRVPERALLTLALWGGWLGAKLAQHQFRHKTRKQPFRRRLNQIGLMQLVVVILFQTPIAAPILVGGGRFVAWANESIAAISTNLQSAANQGPQGASKKSALPHRFGPGTADW